MDRIIDILKTVDRPGIDQVIEFMRSSDYAKAHKSGMAFRGNEGHTAFYAQ